jgi:hypothetical protein
VGPNYKDLTNKRFNKLLVIKDQGRMRDGTVKWLCQCDCGNECYYQSRHLTRKKNPVKSCGCKRDGQKGSNHSQWTGHEGISGSWWQNHILREINGKRHKVPVTIKINEGWDLLVKQDFKCSLSGLPIYIEGNGGTASLDRVDSSKGYEMGNVQWTHKHVNFMKYTHTQEYFIALCKKVATHNG